MDAGRPSKRAVVEMSDSGSGLKQCDSLLDGEPCMDTNSGSIRTDTVEPRIKQK